MTTTTALKNARAQYQGSVPENRPGKAVEDSWRNATVLTGRLADEIARLKAQPGKILLAHGGAGFAQGLVQFGLVDEYWLLVHPVVLGRGLPLFGTLAKPLKLRLVSTNRFREGAVAHVYQPRA
jgi:dihydrofolate reductase